MQQTDRTIIWVISNALQLYLVNYQIITLYDQYWQTNRYDRITTTLAEVAMWCGTTHHCTSAWSGCGRSLLGRSWPRPPSTRQSGPRPSIEVARWSREPASRRPAPRRSCSVPSESRQILLRSAGSQRLTVGLALCVNWAAPAAKNLSTTITITSRGLTEFEYKFTCCQNQNQYHDNNRTKTFCSVGKFL